MGREHGLAGRDVKSVMVPELAWMGWSNGHTRALANGRFVSLMFARSIREANFMSLMQSKIKDKQWDLDQLASKYCEERGFAPPSESSEVESRSWKMDKLTQFVANQLQPFHSEDLKSAQDRIKKLETELAAAQAGEPASSVITRKA